MESTDLRMEENGAVGVNDDTESGGSIESGNEEAGDDPETVMAEVAGAFYYSDPNRIVLFYGDAEVSGEYTAVGYFDDTEEFRSAVENNPVLEGWDTKMVNISR